MPTPEEIEVQKAAEAEAARTAAGGAPDRKVISLPAASLGRIRREEREAGKKAAMQELDEQAKAAGFESYADMAGYLGGLKKDAAARPQNRGGGEQRRRDERPRGEQPRRDEPRRPEADVQTSTKADRRLARRIEELERNQARQRDEARQAKRQAEEAQRERDRAEARMQLALIAAEQGIVGERNIRYALHTLDEELQSMDDKAREELDERKFFSSLAEQMPSLRGAGEKKPPLTTGTGGGAATATQGKPGAAVTTAGEDKGPKTVSLGAPSTAEERAKYRKEFEDALAKHGLNPDFGHGISVNRA